MGVQQSTGVREYLLLLHRLIAQGMVRLPCSMALSAVAACGAPLPLSSVAPNLRSLCHAENSDVLMLDCMNACPLPYRHYFCLVPEHHGWSI